MIYRGGCKVASLVIMERILPDNLWNSLRDSSTRQSVEYPSLVDAATAFKVAFSRVKTSSAINRPAPLTNGDNAQNLLN